MSAKLSVLQELIEPSVVALGYQLWGIEMISQGRHSMLRIYIDAEQGIGVEDCASVSRQVSGILDVEDPISGEYTLEVSSPGMDRPLFTLEQYQAFVGHVVQLKLRMPFEGRRRFKGILSGIEDEDIVLVVDQEEYLLPIDHIEKANIVPQF
ncbi:MULTISPECIES: ribosome maturation factor RimP [Amphritea]|uniref:Ribosome maturation factor RimP n=2 Tax=Amphritea TaxID=515417 RepID=A0A1H9LEM1_9GAMM|nr:ribosome maturation factor RimP [Amphritea atlantica]MBN0989675.1 ribosome maturation factor RimP [Amphritea pacifica]MBN1008996.1 ribosome maturation factor RimP [Amphritea pacifica]SER09699.1 ribosome maturation factor RimP [Amphritea atlantica]